MAKKDDTNPKDRLGIKKVPLSLMPNVGVIYTALVFELGARKYGEFNWRNKKVRLRVYIEAIKRHVMALEAGENMDAESGLPHEAHIAACSMILMDARACGALIDDRFEKDATAKLLASFTARDHGAALRKLTRTPARTLDEVREAARRAKRKAACRRAKTA